MVEMFFPIDAHSPKLIDSVLMLRIRDEFLTYRALEVC